MYPRLIHLYGPVWVYSYGTMIALGFFVFLFFAFNHKIRQRFMTPDQFLNTLFIGFMSGVIGGRVLFVATHIDFFYERWYEIFFPWEGGFTVIGSIIGVLVTVPFYLKLLKIPILPILDLASIFAPLMQAIARLGCLLAGCCYGMIVKSPEWWNSIIFWNKDGFAPCGVPLYPTQIYMSIASFLIFCFMIIIQKNSFFMHGQLVCVYLFLESLARFSVDFWRGDQENMYMIGVNSLQIINLSQLQIFSFLLSFCSLVMFFILAKNKSNISR